MLTDQEKMLVLRAKSQGPELYSKATGLSAVARVAQRRGVRYLLKGDTVEVLGSQSIIEHAQKDVENFLTTNPSMPAQRQLPARKTQAMEHAGIRAKVKEWADTAGAGSGLSEQEKEDLTGVTFFGPELGWHSKVSGSHL